MPTHTLFRSAALALLLGVTAMTPATAADGGDFTPTTTWRTFEKWTVQVDHSMHGCFMQAVYPMSGTVVRFGISRPNAGPGNGYIMLFNASGVWSSLAPGQTLPMTVKFDGAPKDGWSAWSGKSHIMGDSKTTALTLTFNNPEVWSGVTYATAFHVAYRGNAVIDGQLYGSAQATGSMAECQRAYNASNNLDAATPPPRRDPFIGVGDPFKAI